ncbi:MAG: hypothetical protein EKK50_01725 [Sphingomonadaceae bacterium]|nr:MAG: hypothetical protein EKK50_01725 [Sphingomonadaceae bacterium]
MRGSSRCVPTPAHPHRHSRAGGNPEPLTARLRRGPARLDSRLRGNDGTIISIRHCHPPHPSNLSLHD